MLKKVMLFDLFQFLPLIADTSLFHKGSNFAKDIKLKGCLPHPYFRSEHRLPSVKFASSNLERPFVKMIWLNDIYANHIESLQYSG